MDDNETWDGRVMNIDVFWGYVELCKKDPVAFQQKAEQFSEQEFVDICWIYKCMTAELADYENFDHFGDVTLSEDHMEDLSWWCVDQGREFYERVLADTSLIPRDVPDNKSSVYSVTLKIYLGRYDDYPYQPDELQTPEELHKYVMQLVREREKSKRNLEYYLLALLHQVEAAKDKQPSYRDIMVFLRNSYKGEMADYSNDWVKLPERLHESNTEAYFKEIDTYEYFERTLKVYIADLHYIRTSIKHAFASSFRNESHGIIGRGGIIWQRTDVARFLATAVSSLENEGKDSELEPGWNFFADLIADGATKE